MNEFELYDELWNRKYIECVGIYDKALDIAKRKENGRFDKLILEFLRKVIILEHGMVSCIYEFVLHM